MPDVLQAFREKYPRYAEVPDDELGPAIVAKFPRYLEVDPGLKRFVSPTARASAPLTASAGATAGAPTSPATPSPAAGETLSDTAGFMDAFSRGWSRLTQAQSRGESGTSAIKLREERRGYEQAMQDPRYHEQSAVPPWQMDPFTGQPRDRARMVQVEGTVGPAGKTELASRNRQTRRETAVADVAATEAELRAAPRSAGMAELAKATTTAGKWKAWAKNPIEITSQIAAESLVQAAPAIAAMPLVGPASAAAMGGFTTELSSGVLESAQEQGYDIADPKRLQAFLDNPAARAEAQGYALKRASIIGAIDGATAGAAGKLLARTLGKGMAKVGAGVAGEAGLQAAGGAAGEALAQKATGKPLDSFEIAMEAIAEIASGPAEIVSNLYRERATRAAPQSATAEPGFNGSPAITINEEGIAIDQGTGQPLPISDSGRPQGPSTGQAQIQGEAGPVGGGANLTRPLPDPAAETPAPTSFQFDPAALAELDAAAASALQPAEVGRVSPSAPVVAPVDTAPPAVTLPDGQVVGAETITVSNERRGSEMAAELPAGQAEAPAVSNPTPTTPPVPRRARPERGWDLIDELEGWLGRGRIDPKLIREANPGWQPAPGIRHLFRKDGIAADKAADALAKAGIYRGDPGQMDQLGAALNETLAKRKGTRQLNIEGRQADQFQRRVIEGQRPQREAPKVAEVPAGELNKGDRFKVQGQKFTVKAAEFDEDGRTTSITLKDGPKFGTQTLTGQETLHIDKGTLRSPTKSATGWDAVKEARDEASQAFKDWQGGASGGFNQAMFVYYGKLVKLAYVASKAGVKTAAEFAQKLGRQLDAMIQRAWDDAQAGTVARSVDELADDVVQAARDSERERQFSTRMAADERLDPAFREATGNRTYQPVPNLQTYSEALAEVQARGIDGALTALKDENNGIEPRVRVLLGQAIITQGNHEFAQTKQEAALDRGVDAAEWLTEFGTRLGQGVQAFAVWSRLTPEGIGRAYVRGVERINDKATRGMTPIQKAKARLKLPRADKGTEAEVRQRARKALAKPEGFQRDEAVIDVLSFIQRKTEPVRWWETLFALWYANILSGWTTQTINIASTAANVFAEAASHMAAKPRDAARILTGLGSGGFRGMWDALAILQTGKVTGTRIQKLELPRVLERIRFTGGYLNPLNYAKFVSRVMAASDMVFFRSAEEMKGRLLARRLAQSENLSGRALSRRVYEILHNTPALREQARVKALAEGFKQGSRDYYRRYYELIEQARPEELRGTAAEFGRTATFNDQPHGVLGALANLAAKFGRQLPPFKLLVPFTHVVSNVANRSLNFTPWGYKRLFWGHFTEKPEINRHDFGTEEYNIQAARATIGTTLLTALAAAALQNLDDEDPPFMIYGKGPLDPKRGYQLRQSGWRPYTIKVGNQYYNYLGTPLHLGLAMVGNYIDAWRYQGMGEREVTARMAYAVKSNLRTLMDQTFLSSLRDFLTSITQGGISKDDPLKGAGRFVAGAAIPNLIKQVDAIFDPTIYTADDLTAALLRDLPVVRHHSDLKPMLNVLGAPVRRDRVERFVSPEINDPVWQMISAKQAWIGSPTTTTKLGDRNMTPDELYEYVRLSGPNIRRRLEDELSYLNTLSREQAKDRVESIVRQERAAAKDILRGQMYQ